MVTETASHPDASGPETALLSGVDPSLYPFEPKFVTVDGGHRMHYVDEGTGDPVVMVHGNPSWSFYYRDLIRRLAPDYRALAPDHIGCGRSDKPGEDDYEFTLARRVADFDHFIDETVPDGGLTLVLHDWGGMIGMRWAVEHPERIERLVLLNTAAFHLPETKRLPAALWLVRETRLGKFLVDRFNAFSRGATRFCVTDKMSDDVARGYRAPYEAQQDRLATLKFVEDIPLEPADPGYDLITETEEQLPSFADLPILIGWGLEDFVFDSHFLDRWRTIFPDADYAIYPDAGHYVLEDRAEELGRQIEEFL